MILRKIIPKKLKIILKNHLRNDLKIIKKIF